MKVLVQKGDHIMYKKCISQSAFSPLVNYISPVVSWLSSGAFIENHYIIVLEREWKSSIALVLFVYFSRIH
jgi:hypothetical protein